MLSSILLLQDPPNFLQISIFGLKICHLATLIRTRAQNSEPGWQNPPGSKSQVSRSPVQRQALECNHITWDQQFH
jgi:hypothetical protein